MISLFQIHCRVSDRDHIIDYRDIDACLADRGLRALLDGCVLGVDRWAQGDARFAYVGAAPWTGDIEQLDAVTGETMRVIDPKRIVIDRTVTQPIDWRLKGFALCVVMGLVIAIVVMWS